MWKSPSRKCWPDNNSYLVGGSAGSGPGHAIIRSGRTPFHSRESIRALGILREIRALPEVILKLAASLHRITGRLDSVIRLQQEMGPSEARLEDLERSRAAWEATMEAELQKASSTYKSAANAESRARTMENHAAKLTDPFTEDGESLEEGVPPEYAQVGEAEGMQPVRMDVAPVSQKELAKRMKFMS